MATGNGSATMADVIQSTNRASADSFDKLCVWMRETSTDRYAGHDGMQVNRHHGAGLEGIEP